MTRKELQEALNAFPEDMPISITCGPDGDDLCLVTELKLIDDKLAFPYKYKGDTKSIHLS